MIGSRRIEKTTTMESTSSDTSPMSLHLARVLDEIGLNEKTVACRRNHVLQFENLNTLHMQCIEEGNCTFYCFGSQSEGTTTLGLNSDIDILWCVENYNVIQDMVEWQKGKLNLLMVFEDTAPGYCRLQLIKKHEPRPETDSPNEYYTLDTDGNVVMKSSRYLPSVDEPRHGPAISFINRKYSTDSDFILAMRCRTLPPQVREWLGRERHGDWPTQDVLQKATMDDIFLVPVGHKLSQYQDQEWRISCSLIERRLMFSMNMVQLKCYVVLKMLIKSYVTPRAEDSISSYHCKTALMHCIEDSYTCPWQEDNLVECIVMCLTRLMTWVKKSTCPGFIMSTANLFAGKITDKNQNDVFTALYEIVSNIGNHLIGISIDELGHQLQLSINAAPAPSSTNNLNSLKTVMVLHHSCVEFYRGLLIHMKNSCAKLSSLGSKSMIKHLEQSIQRLNCFSTSRTLSPYELQPLRSLSRHMCFLLGSLKHSAFISGDMTLPSEAKEEIRLCADSDIPLMLRRASILYCTGCFKGALQELFNVDSCHRRYLVQPVCGCYANLVGDNDFAKKLFAKDRHYEERSICLAGCVTFSPHEAFCTPIDLRYEFYRSVGEDKLHRNPSENKWMDLAVADSLPFMYYLQYKVHSALGNHHQKKSALDCLEKCLSDENIQRYLSHKETSLNLFGKCLEEEGDPDALFFYAMSLGLRRRNNAAVWHLGVAYYHYLRKAGKCA